MIPPVAPKSYNFSPTAIYGVCENVKTMHAPQNVTPLVATKSDVFLWTTIYGVC